jgi:hypothetical protein
MGKRARNSVFRDIGKDRGQCPCPFLNGRPRRYCHLPADGAHSPAADSEAVLLAESLTLNTAQSTALGLELPRRATSSSGATDNGRFRGAGKVGLVSEHSRMHRFLNSLKGNRHRNFDKGTNWKSMGETMGLCGLWSRRCRSLLL